MTTGDPLTLRPVHAMDDLREVTALFSAVWGRGPEGAPMPSEVLRAVEHAGGLVNAAYAGPDGPLVGAAVLTPTADGAGYSMIAAALPGQTDRGIGQALKEHQRRWALDHGMTSIRWTFDPLVSRNARFNLDKLGATAGDYDRSFYGSMLDEINGDDESDRLTARWDLANPMPSDTPPPDPARSTVLALGPDRDPAYLTAGPQRWVRVPMDIVAVRRATPEQATAWRYAVREFLEDALGSRLIATGMSRTGWYHLTQGVAP